MLPLKKDKQSPGIGVPFNVQHVAHIGADNVEALLLAAKDDPKLLPSFLLPDGVSSEKEDGKKSVGKGKAKTDGKSDKEQPSTKQTSRDVDKNSSSVLSDSNTDNATANDEATRIQRAPSLSKPTPKPRPRSIISEKDPENGARVDETTVKPVALPRTKVKSSGVVFTESNHPATKAPKPEPPQRPDLNPPPPVKPKCKLVINEPLNEQKNYLPASDSESLEVTNVSSENITFTVPDFLAGVSGQDSSEEPFLKVAAKKAGPPPIPRRVDLE